MKIAERSHTDIVAGSMDEIAVTIAANAVSFHAQISGLAKNKIEYPMREVCSNAWDAARGDFDVQLPTELDPIFRVRDRGPGMSHEMMVSIYAVIYASTKRASDTEVGGWGLGRFSPFAYLIGEDGAASYTVTSFHDGRARSYLLAVGDRGPTLRLLSDEVTDEPTGMEVIFAVRPADIGAFHAAAKRILWAFEPRPNVTPEIAYPDATVRLSGPGWNVYTGNLPFTGPQVRMGCAYYPVELAQVDNPGGIVKANTPVMFEISIGSVSVTLSREALAYDERTRRTVSAALASYVESYSASLQAEVDTAQTYFEACALIRRQADYQHFLSSVTWRGLTLKKEIAFRQDGDIASVMKLDEGWTLSGIERFERDSCDTKDAIGRVLVLEHNPSQSLARLKAAGLVGRSLVWVRIKRAHREAFLAGIGNPDCVTLDAFAAEARAGRPKTLRRRRTLIVNNSGGAEETQEVDMAAGGLFLKNWNNTSRYVSYQHVRIANRASLRLDDFRTCVRKLITLGFLTTGQSILIATDNEQPPEGWTWFGDAMHARLLPLAQDFRPTGLEGKTTESIDSGLRFLLELPVHAPMPNDVRELLGDARSIVQQISELRSGTEAPASTAYQIIHHFGDRPALPDGFMHSNALPLLFTRFEAIKQRYAMLPLIVYCASQISRYYTGRPTPEDVRRGALDYLRTLALTDDHEQLQEAA